MTTHDPVARAHSGPDSDELSGPERVAGQEQASESPADPTGTPGGIPAGSTIPDVAAALFGDRLALAEEYARLLVTDGVVRGLIGPREAPRIWERHLLNCAAMAELIPTGSTVLDVGSGAGLPGLVLAITRPDLSIGLVEPLARRTVFLTEVVESLGLAGSVVVLRARAEEVAAGSVETGMRPAGIVTARALAPLDRLARWCLPLVEQGGRLLAMKGASAIDEVAEHAAVINRLGGGTPAVRHCGAGLLDPPTTVVEIVRERTIGSPRARSSSRPAVADAERGRRSSSRRQSPGGRGTARGANRAGGGHRG